METLDREFRTLLQNHNIEELDVYSGVVYGIWEDFRIAYLNPGWFHFAKKNAGEPQISQEWGLGQSILDCVSGDVKEYYEAHYNECLTSHKVWEHEYECSSDEIYRKYHQIVYPLGEHEGLLIVNSLVVEKPHDLSQKQVRAANKSHYLDKNGLICQCAYCRMVKNFREVERWDWVPEWVKECPENTSHTFCPTCFSHYFTKPTTDE